MRLPTRILALLATVALATAACTDSSPGPTGPWAAGVPDLSATQYPRAQTLYTTGTQWSPPDNWNPLMNWEYATGTVGLVYEPLFLYDPQRDQFTPWLAEHGDWVDDTTYQLNLRPGVSWSDGKPLTADDVVFTLRLCRYKSVPYSTLCDWMTDARAVAPLTVRVTFSTPNYQEWANWLYAHPVLPEHLWRGRSEREIVAGANPDPVGTGPYRHLTHGPDRMVWTRTGSWWATKALGLDPKPRYIVDIVAGSNNVALAQMLQGGIDLSNNYLPGVASVVNGGYGLKTYYSGPPYMLPANTVWLVPNTTRAPLDDPAFRRALAWSVDVRKIVHDVYDDLVTPSSPTGLLPYWSEYDDKATIDRLGFHHDPVRARQLLTSAGYRDADRDGLVENRDGSPLRLTLTLPSGWTDWKEAAKVIVAGAKEAGIDVEIVTSGYGAFVDARTTGEFDLVLDNEHQVSNSPWTYYDYLFRSPVQARQTTVNFARYDNPRAWALVRQLDRTPTTDPAAMKAVIARLQQIHLSDLPAIPLWASAMWAQYSEDVWTGWPSATGPSHAFPTTWRDFWQMGSIRLLTSLTPAPARKT